MKFMATADTDIGISKKINQDSLLIKHAKIDEKEVLLAIICDGMGGLSQGELASATVVKSFSEWFNTVLNYGINRLNVQLIGQEWDHMLKELNSRILDYSDVTKSSGIGTTFTGILFVDNQYVIGHVGDTRVYHIGTSLKQMTTDQTYVAREISRGTMTLEQAKVDKRRNLLLQCVGASQKVEPEIIYGEAQKGVYMICSDGFRHEITEQEMYESLNPIHLMNKETMHSNAKYLIEQVKMRKEKDNISVILIKAE